MDAHLRSLALKLLASSAGDRFLFWFSARAAPFIALEAPTPRGRARFQAIRERAPDGVKCTSGLAVVESDGRVLVAVPGASERFLAVLAGTVLQLLEREPGLTGLLGCRAVDASVDLHSDASLEAFDPAAHPVLSHPAAWGDPERFGVASVASLLAEALPGQAFWYVLAPTAPLPLLLTSFQRDPFGTHLNQRALQLLGAAPADLSWVRGQCHVDGHGTLQFSEGWVDGADRIADWVQGHAADHPGLLRLLDARFAGSPIPMSAKARPTSTFVAPATALEVGSYLAGDRADDTAWFWLGQSPEGALLTVMDAAADPQADAFQVRSKQLSSRFGSAPHLVGSMTRLASADLLFTALSGSAGVWKTLLTALLETHSEHPKLEPLWTANLAVVADGRIVDAARMERSLA